VENSRLSLSYSVISRKSALPVVSDRSQQSVHNAPPAQRSTRRAAWAQQLGKTSFRAFQASARGGEVICRLAGDRVELEGGCVFYLEGHVEI